MEQFTASTWEETILDGIAKSRHRDGRLKADLIRKIAALKSRAGCDSFPTGVDQLAHAVGIHRIRYVPLAITGRLVREPRGLVAEINTDLSPRDRRFVLAHEVAHLILERDAINSASQRLQRAGQSTGLGYKQVESLCDYGAREILLPAASLRAELKKHKPDLKVVSAIADEAQCSAEVVAGRICEPFGPWEGISFLWWKFGERGAEIVEIIPSSAALVELADEHNSLSRRALFTSSVVAGHETIWVGTGPRCFSAQALHIAQQQVMMLAAPRVD